MAGDGGRAPDVSEQRAEIDEAGIEAAMRAAYDGWPQMWSRDGEPRTYEECYGCAPLDHKDDRAEMEVAVAAYLSHADPASVLAALLAEHPDATVAALETLLTNDKAVEAGRQAIHSGNGCTCRRGARGDAHDALSAACRSLRPKAPKEDRDA